jgi:hypothetical protein
MAYKLPKKFESPRRYLIVGAQIVVNNFVALYSKTSCN